MTKRFIIPKCDTKFTVESEVVGFIKYDPPFPGDLPEVEKSLRTIVPSQQISGFVLDKIWDLIRLNESMLINQFEANITKRKIPKALNVIGSQKNLFVAKEASIYDLTVIDVRDGPVYIDEGAVIQPFTTIVGPSYIGQRTIVGRAKIIKSNIGPACRIGGEVESCIFQCYANKYHEGFLGHSFIGEWVNIGASTTNSDLKNNYGPLRVVIGDKEYAATPGNVFMAKPGEHHSVETIGDEDFELVMFTTNQVPSDVYVS